MGGLEGVLVSAALSGVGMMMQQNAADDTAKKQQRIIDQNAEEQKVLNEKKAQTIENFAASTYNAGDRLKNYETAATNQEAKLVNALNTANGAEGGNVNSDVEGNLSSDYDRKRAESTANATSDILKRARLMARTNASGLMYNDEALKGADLASEVGMITSDQNRLNRDTQTSIGGIRNQGSLVGGLLSGASGMAGQAVQNKINTGTFSGK